MSKGQLSDTLPKNSLIPFDLKQAVNASEHTDALVTAINAAAKSILVATDTVTNASTNGSKTLNVSEVIGKDTSNILDKLIDPDIKKAIINEGHGQNVKQFLDEFLPQLLPALEGIAEKENASAKVSNYTLPFPASSKVSEAPKQSAKSSSIIVDQSPLSSSGPNAKSLIKPKTKIAINEHPHRESVKKVLSSFIKKILPVVEKAAEVGGEIAVKATSTAIETAIKGSTGKLLASTTSTAITSTITEFNGAIEEAKSGTKLISPELKEQIELHPHRAAIKEFFKLFLPKFLEVLKAVAKVGIGVATNIGMNLLEKESPELFKTLKVKELATTIVTDLEKNKKPLELADNTKAPKDDHKKLVDKIPVSKTDTHKVTKADHKKLAESGIIEKPPATTTDTHKATNSDHKKLAEKVPVSKTDLSKATRVEVKKLAENIPPSKVDTHKATKADHKKLAESGIIEKPPATKTDTHKATKADLRKVDKINTTEKSPEPNTDFSEVTQQVTKGFLNPIDIAGANHSNDSAGDIQ